MIENFIGSLNELYTNIASLSIEIIMQNAPIIVAVLLPIMFRKPLASFILGRILFFMRKTHLSDATLRHFAEHVVIPLNLVGYLLSIVIANEYFNLSQFGSFITDVEQSLLVITVFWFIHSAIDPIGVKVKALKSNLSKEMITFILKSLKIIVVFLAIAAVLETWGIKVAPILAGLGLFGVAVALGAQDLFKNLIAGVLVIAEKRFEQGEWIKIDGVVEGTVDNIGFRSTKIVRFDKAPVFVPNTKLSDNVVTNFSRMPQRRIRLNFGVLYSTSVEQLKTITEKVHKFIIEDERFNTDDLTNFVRIDAFNDSSIDILVYCFTEDTAWVNWLEAREDLICKIKEIVIAEGSDFAFPSTSLYLADDEKEILESFTNSKKKTKTKEVK